MQNCGSSTLLRVGVWHPLRASQGSTFLPDDIYLWKTQTEGGQMASIKPNNTKKKARNSLLYSNNVLRRSLSNALRLSFNLVLLYSRNILKLFRPFMAIFWLYEEWKTKVFHVAWRNQTCGADANEGFDREDVNFNDASSHRLGSSVLSVLRTAEQCSECSGVLLYSKRWWCLAVMTAIKSHQSRASYPC